MSILTERVPDTVVIDGRTYPIQVDFRAGIAFELAILSGKANTEEILNLYFPGGWPHDLIGAMERIMWFYQCGDQEEKGEGPGRGSSRREYDFDQDADALYASFMRSYHIDLSVAEIHWWVFRKLMFGLPADTPFMERIHYRTADTSGMSKERRRHYEKLRARFALKGQRGKRESLAARNGRMKDYVAKRLREAEGQQKA